MKNIHVLPTYKPSRLHNVANGNLILDNDLSYTSWYRKHIYITYNEEIKEGDWFIYKNEIIHRDKGKIDSMWVDAVKNGKKIILTTDQDLIKDGVQPIPNEFLEWFVKNPSCDRVELMNVYGYAEIIIPKEEPKLDWYCPKCQSYISSESVTFEEIHELCKTSVIIEQFKKEK